MKLEVAVLGSPPLIVLMVSEDVKYSIRGRTRELCESRGSRPGLPIPNKPQGFCGRKATLSSN